MQGGGYKQFRVLIIGFCGVNLLTLYFDNWELKNVFVVICVYVGLLWEEENRMKFQRRQEIYGFY